MEAAGIDVHKRVLMAVVVDASRPEEKPARRRFATMPSEQHRLLTWLREQEVEEAVMESTVQYWRLVWLELEPHMRLQLAQAFSDRARCGRKHDFKDAERLVRRLIERERNSDCTTLRVESDGGDASAGITLIMDRRLPSA